VTRTVGEDGKMWRLNQTSQHGQDCWPWEDRARVPTQRRWPADNLAYMTYAWSLPRRRHTRVRRYVS